MIHNNYNVYFIDYLSTENKYGYSYYGLTNSKYVLNITNENILKWHTKWYIPVYVNNQKNKIICIYNFILYMLYSLAEYKIYLYINNEIHYIYK